MVDTDPIKTLYNKEMKIALNGQRLSAEFPAGPEKYTINLYNALAKVDKTNEYIVYTDSPADKIHFKIDTETNANFKIKYLKGFLSWTQITLAAELFKNPPDIFFTPVHTLPLIRPYKTKIVGMIHGLEFRFNTYKSFVSRLLKGRHEWYVAKFSDTLIIPSEATKNEIIKMKWDVSESKMIIVDEGVGDCFYKRSPSEIAEAKSKHGLVGDYLIFISTIQPRKNLPNLIEAFSELAKEKPGLKLAVVGKLGWSYHQSLDAPKKFGVENKVVFLGRVPDEDIPALISGADAFVSASLEEGFGLPLLESMACETPCIVSDIEAFKQLGQEDMTYFDPLDVKDIKSKLSGFYINRYPPDMIRRAKERSQHYTWEIAAEKTIEVFRRTVDNG